MEVLITGSDGFIGKNLIAQLSERKDTRILRFTRKSTHDDLRLCVEKADFIFHLAGVNRPQNVSEFASGNAELTHALCEAVRACARTIPIVLTSSIQAERENPYGVSKKAAEDALLRHQELSGSPVHICRLPNVFGKWCRPNYNSAVATFCHNLARDLSIQIHDAAAPVSLVYIDDVMASFLSLLEVSGKRQPASVTSQPFFAVTPVYDTTVGKLAEQIRAFKDSRNTLVTERVGTGFMRALYSTYVSYLPPELFTYELTKHADPRGEFAEVLKTHDSGQFSYFTAHAGVTRGGHYHHSKTEKFLVLRGRAKFRFRHIATDERLEILTSGDKPQVVETVPGWAHDITNIGDDEMIVMLWANEAFDRDRPDTFACQM